MPNAPPDSLSPPFDVTIEDVLVDGTFPADGYHTRMRRWAQSTISAGDQ